MGSIPACAGEPPRHPWASLAASGGLSPRVRGTFTGKRPAGTLRVYPRVCGGTSCWLCTAASAAGLSPRVRGNHEDGTTPMDQLFTSVYPRVCGGTSTEFIRLFAASRTPHPRTCPHQPNRDHLPSSPPYQKPTFGKRDICPKILRWGRRNCTRTRRDPTPVRVRGAALVIDVPNNVLLAVFAQSARSGYFGPASPKMTGLSCPRPDDPDPAHSQAWGKISPAGLILKIRCSVARPDDLDRPKARTLKSSLRSKPELSSGVQLQNESPGRAERQRQRRDDTRPGSTRRHSSP